MTLEQIFIAIIGFTCAVGGWFARELYAATQQLRKDLASLEVQISRDYVRYDRLQDALKPILEGIHDIRETLKSKADK
jgi:hypothetical protein